MRAFKDVRDEVLSRAGRYREVHPERHKTKDPSPLKVKEVKVGERRYVVCLNEEQRRKDAADREAIVASLQEQLTKGDKSLIGNRGYRRFVAASGERFRLDEDKIAREARYDGKWVLRTNTTLAAEEVALKYKQLWMVEEIFRSAKTLLETRPIYHKRDETIRGHVFCSFLALVLRTELQRRLDAAGHGFEWAAMLRDLNNLSETEVAHEGKRFVLRDTTHGVAGKVCQAVGVALPPTVRQLQAEADQ
jgi:hypothetical protein